MLSDKTDLEIQYLMSSPVVTIRKNETLEQVAKVMSKKHLGSIIIIAPNGKPLGIITEKDIVIRLTAMNQLPRKVKAEKVMSQPLITIAPNTDIKEAAKSMNEHRIQRLLVVEKGKIRGIITNRDIFDKILIGER